MATQSQTAANQANSKLSTGPVTAQGKATASQNSTCHGLASTIHVVVTSDEDRAAFAALEAGLRTELKPDGTLQELLFRRLLTASWNIERCENIHANLILSTATAGADPLTDPALHATIRLIETYLKRNERSFAQAMKQLRELQTELKFRQGTLPEVEIQSPTTSALVQVARLRLQWSADECARTRTEAAILRRNLDPKFAELRFNELSNDELRNNPAAA